jgi:hypothetical protein
VFFSKRYSGFKIKVYMQSTLRLTGRDFAYILVDNMCNLYIGTRYRLTDLIIVGATQQRNA